MSVSSPKWRSANTLAAFARMIDGRNWADVGRIFADDVPFNYGGDEQQGIAALTALFQSCLDRCGPTQHLIGSIQVGIDGAMVISRSYVQARHQGQGDGHNRIFDTHGDYVDRWEKRAGHWRITRRDALWAMHAGNAG